MRPETPEPPRLGGDTRRANVVWETVPLLDQWRGAPGPPPPERPTRLLFSGVRAGYGGTQSGVRNLLRYLDPDEFSVRILTGQDASGIPELEQYGEVFHLPDLQREGISRMLSDREWVDRFVRRHIWSWRPHLIFAWSGDLFSLERTGIPVVTRVRALNGILPDAVPDGCVCYRVSDACPGDFPVIVPGVEITPPPDPRKRIERHVVRIGRADPDRHPDVFLDALTLLEDEFDRGMTVSVAGEAFYGSWDWAEELAWRGLSDRVRVMGQLPHEKAMDLMDTAAVHVANAPESFGQATAEAMMREVVPVVCSEGYGPQMVDDYGVVAENRPAPLANAIRRALTLSRSGVCGRAARTRAIREYDAERSAQTNIELFRKLTAFPAVDIIMPVKNNRAVTEKCVNSILGNTHYGNYRLLIVDDMSEDDTWEYLQRLAAYDDRVRVYQNNEPMGGIASAMRLVDISYGEYVMLMNNDMLVGPGWLTRLLSGFTGTENLGLLIPVLSDEEKPARRINQGVVPGLGDRSCGLWLREAMPRPDADLAALQARADNSMIAKLLASGWERAMHYGVELYHVGSLMRSKLPQHQLNEAAAIWYERYDDPRDAAGNPVQIGRPKPDESAVAAG